MKGGRKRPSRPKQVRTAAPPPSLIVVLSESFNSGGVEGIVLCSEELHCDSVSGRVWFDNFFESSNLLQLELWPTSHRDLF